MLTPSSLISNVFAEVEGNGRQTIGSTRTQTSSTRTQQSSPQTQQTGGAYATQSGVNANTTMVTLGVISMHDTNRKVHYFQHRHGCEPRYFKLRRMNESTVWIEGCDIHGDTQDLEVGSYRVSYQELVVAANGEMTFQNGRTEIEHGVLTASWAEGGVLEFFYAGEWVAVLRIARWKVMGLYQRGSRNDAATVVRMELEGGTLHRPAQAQAADQAADQGVDQAVAQAVAEQMDMAEDT